MITDKSTNFVFLSSLLKERPELHNFTIYLEKTLNKYSIKYDFIRNTNDLWCRDFMPIQTRNNRFVQFTFAPSYYKDKKWQHLLTDISKVEVEAVPKTTVVHSPILLDGGNLIRSEATVILTERIFKENQLPHEEVIQQLKQTLEVESIHVIPSLPFEVSGHADGMVRLLDNNNLLVADYQTESPSWKVKYEKALKHTGLNIIDFPAATSDIKNGEGEYTALGCYINFAWIGNIILFPQFDMAEDKEALREARQILNCYNVVPVPAADLAMFCGVLNCATWNIQV